MRICSSPACRLRRAGSAPRNSPWSRGGGVGAYTQGFSHADLIALNAQSLHYQVAVARRGRSAALRRPRQLVLLPLRPLRRDGRRGGQGCGLHRLHDSRPRLGSPEEDAYRLHRLRVLGGTTPGSCSRRSQAFATNRRPRLHIAAECFIKRLNAPGGVTGRYHQHPARGHLLCSSSTRPDRPSAERRLPPG